MATTSPVFSAPGLRLEWRYDRWNSWSVVAWKPHTSRIFNDRKALLRFIAWPVKTPTGDLIRGWLDAHLAAIASQQPQEAPAAVGVERSHLSLAESPHQAAMGLTAQQLATGFGPECHAGEQALDPSDPNYQTRTVI